MANQGYVRTAKKMTPERLSELLNQLEGGVFKGSIKFEYVKGERNSWGPHMWLAKLKNELRTCVRVMWLETGRKFVMRHGGGDDWCWWLDETVQATVAREFKGRATDDGVSGPVILLELSYAEWLKNHWRRVRPENYFNSSAYRLQHWEDMVLLGVPKEFLPELGNLREEVVKELSHASGAS